MDGLWVKKNLKFNLSISVLRQCEMGMKSLHNNFYPADILLNQCKLVNFEYFILCLLVLPSFFLMSPSCHSSM